MADYYWEMIPVKMLRYQIVQKILQFDLFSNMHHWQSVNILLQVNEPSDHCSCLDFQSNAELYSDSES